MLFLVFHHIWHGVNNHSDVTRDFAARFGNGVVVNGRVDSIEMPSLSKTSLSKLLFVGISIVTLLNTLVLFSCKFSDSGCPLSNNYQDKSKHLPIPSDPFESTGDLKNKFEKEEEDFESQNRNKEAKKKIQKKSAIISENNEPSTEPKAEGKENEDPDPYKSMNVGSYNTGGNLNNFKPEDYIIAGHSGTSEALLVIGVPTVKRSKASYLLQTLQELVEGLEDPEKKEVLIIVFATDFDPQSVISVVDEVTDKFPNELESGLIRVIKAPHSFYPDLDKLPRLWGDKPERVRWRSKQSLDYAFLFKYCKDLGSYYLQLEDDVSTVKGYLKKIKAFITRHESRKWSMLEFGARGFIGMMYKASDLGRLSTFIKFYYWVSPVDILYRHFNEFHLYGNPQWPRLRPPLFKHVGTFSSLEGQVRKLEDVRGTGRRIYKDNDNPDAEVTTSIRDSIKRSKIQPIYELVNHGMFWGKNIRKGDNILVNFVKPAKISKLIVESGGVRAPEDYFGAANIYHGMQNNDGECEEYTLWKEFKNMPQLKVQNKEGVLCQCLKIEITGLRRDRKGSVRWLALREIAVWTTT